MYQCSSNLQDTRNRLCHLLDWQEVANTKLECLYSFCTLMGILEQPVFFLNILLVLFCLIFILFWTMGYKIWQQTIKKLNLFFSFFIWMITYLLRHKNVPKLKEKSHFHFCFLYPCFVLTHKSQKLNSSYYLMYWTTTKSSQIESKLKEPHYKKFVL